MKLLIKFPTRSRTHKFLNVLKKYKDYSTDDNTFFLITMDSDDKEMNSDFVRDILDSYKNLKYVYGDSPSKVAAINRDIELIEDWDILLLASDDMVPQKKGYDSIIIEKMKEFYPDTDGVLFFNDGFKGQELNTLSILGKKYYERFGYVYYPEYRSVWADNEFMNVADLLGKQTYFDEVIIKHEHPDWGYGKRDIIHTENFSNESHDRILYDKRKFLNFEIK